MPPLSPQSEPLAIRGPAGPVDAKTRERVTARWTTVGTANWDYRSFLDNDELNVVVIDVAFAARMTALFDEDLRNALRIAPDDWRGRPLHRRFLETFWSAWERLL